MGGRPTLYDVGVVDTLDKKVSKEMLNLVPAIRTIIQIILYKLSKPNPNIHDCLLFLESQTGSGKSSSFPVELRRVLFNQMVGLTREQKEEVESFGKPIDGFNMKIFDYPDDEYTKSNKKKGEFAQFNRTKPSILVTQPKILTAVAKAQEIASEEWNPDLELGENVGYTSSGFKMYPSDGNNILYATLGTLNAIFKLRTDREILELFNVCIIDECHIQDNDLMVCVRSIYDFLHRIAGTPNAPLFIFTSATFDVEWYANFFGTSVNNSVLVRGGQVKYTEHYLDKPTDDYVQAAIDKVWELHTSNPNDPEDQNDILVFLSSNAAMGSVKTGLEKLDVNKELMVYKLSSAVVNAGGKGVALIETMPLEDVRKYEKRPGIKRRVTVSTPVAETGITILTLKYSVVSGYFMTSSYSAMHDCKILATRAITNSARKQQAGRVGRKFPGEAHFLFTKETAEMLDEYDYPSTYRSDISKNLLDVLYSNVPPEYLNDPMGAEKFKSFCSGCLDIQKAKPSKTNLNCKNIYTNSMIEKSDVKTNDDFMSNGSKIQLLDHPPKMLYDFPRDSYLVARAKLIRLGLYGTYPGYLASKMSRLSVEGAKMILSACAYGVSMYDACVMAALLETGRKDYQINKYKSGKLGISMYDRRKIAGEVIKSNELLLTFGNTTGFMDSISDDFIEFLIVVKFVCKKMKNGDYKKYTKICLEYGIDYRELNGIFSLITMFMNTAEEMGLKNQNPSIDFSTDLMNTLARLKSVIYSGLRCNSAKLNDRNVHVSGTGLEIKLKGFVGKKPQKILYAGLISMATSNSVKYATTVGLVSSMDGWF